MNKLGLALLMAICIVLGAWWKFQKKPLTAIAPKQCVFHVDTIWSASFQKEVKQAIVGWYAVDKSPSDVIEKTITKYHEVAAIQSQICNSDKICFHLQSVQPLFILNKTDVVDSSGLVSLVDNFDEAILSKLPHVQSDQEHQISDMIFFVKNISSDICLRHVIDWKDKHLVVLQDSNLSLMRCVTCVDLLPTTEKVDVCRQLYDQHIANQRKKAKKNIMTYDIRFKNQIIEKFGG